MKKCHKVYLDEGTFSKLKKKADEAGFPLGRGWLGAYLTFLAEKDIVFLDQNLKKLLGVLNLKTG